MITKLYTISSQTTDPHKNLALEEYLLHQVADEECILYLWQNYKTVVIGKNQNPWRECRTGDLSRAGGTLVRRLSGGGAVFHDMGNLNFTFLVKAHNYDLEKQLQVILDAVKSAGIPAEKSGRNDITVDGKKFSGNAFYRTAEQCYHHGTLMVDVNKEDLTRYLSVSEEKLKWKGVASVRSRVMNLREADASLTTERLGQLLEASFQQVYGRPVDQYPEEKIETAELDRLEEKYRSAQWTWGRKIDFTHCISRKFGWGEVSLELEVKDGQIKDAAVYSDSLETAWINPVRQQLAGTAYQEQEIIQALINPQSERLLTDEMKIDIKGLIRDQF